MVHKQQHKDQANCLVFPCTQCGQCCRHVHLSAQTHHLDSGNGICVHLDRHTNLCEIYDERPDFCRVEVMYQKHYQYQISWSAFVKANLEVCEKLINNKPN